MGLSVAMKLLAQIILASFPSYQVEQERENRVGQGAHLPLDVMNFEKIAQTKDKPGIFCFFYLILSPK